MNPQTLIDLAMQLDRLESLPRMGYLMRGIAHPESVAAHVFGVAVWSMLLADELGGVDPLKVLRLALLHELGEVKLTDIPKIAEEYLPLGAKDAAETKIAAELLSGLEVRGEEYLRLFTEYQEARTREARLVHAADKLQMMAKVLRYQQNGATGVDGFWNHAPNFRDFDLPEVREIFAELRRRRPVVATGSPAEP
ncbi:MAG: HD domain-containing protein [Myxococcales bacterium]|nr:HD domain-containing protein [Myxococcales bacterium]